MTAVSRVLCAAVASIVLTALPAAAVPPDICAWLKQVQEPPLICVPSAP